MNRKLSYWTLVMWQLPSELNKVSVRLMRRLMLLLLFLPPRPYLLLKLVYVVALVSYLTGMYFVRFGSFYVEVYESLRDSFMRIMDVAYVLALAFGHCLVLLEALWRNRGERIMQQFQQLIYVLRMQFGRKVNMLRIRRNCNIIYGFLAMRCVVIIIMAIYLAASTSNSVLLTTSFYSEIIISMRFVEFSLYATLVLAFFNELYEAAQALVAELESMRGEWWNVRQLPLERLRALQRLHLLMWQILRNIEHNFQLSATIVIFKYFADSSSLPYWIYFNATEDHNMPLQINCTSQEIDLLLQISIPCWICTRCEDLQCQLRSLFHGVSGNRKVQELNRALLCTTAQLGQETCQFSIGGLFCINNDMLGKDLEQVAHQTMLALDSLHADLNALLKRLNALQELHVQLWKIQRDIEHFFKRSLTAILFKYFVGAFSTPYWIFRTVSSNYNIHIIIFCGIEQISMIMEIAMLCWYCTKCDQLQRKFRSHFHSLSLNRRLEILNTALLRISVQLGQESFQLSVDGLMNINNDFLGSDLEHVAHQTMLALDSLHADLNALLKRLNALQELHVQLWKIQRDIENFFKRSLTAILSKYFMGAFLTPYWIFRTVSSNVIHIIIFYSYLNDGSRLLIVAHCYSELITITRCSEFTLYVALILNCYQDLEQAAQQAMLELERLHIDLSAALERLNVLQELHLMLWQIQRAVECNFSRSLSAITFKYFMDAFSFLYWLYLIVDVHYNISSILFCSIELLGRLMEIIMLCWYCTQCRRLQRCFRSHFHSLALNRRIEALNTALLRISVQLGQESCQFSVNGLLLINNEFLGRLRLLYSFALLAYLAYITHWRFDFKYAVIYDRQYDYLSKLIDMANFVALIVSHVLIGMELLWHNRSEQIASQFNQMFSLLRQRLGRKVNQQRIQLYSNLVGMLLVLRIAVLVAMTIYNITFTTIWNLLFANFYSELVLILRCGEFSLHLVLVLALYQELHAAAGSVLQPLECGKQQLHGELQLAVQRVGDLQQLHMLFWRTQRDIERYFGRSLGIIIWKYFVDTTVMPYWVYLNRARITSFATQLWCATEQLGKLVEIIVPCWCCTRCEYLQRKFRALFHGLTANRRHDDVNAALLQISAQLGQESCQFSVGGLWNINNDMLAKFLFGMVSYIFIFIQFRLTFTDSSTEGAVGNQTHFNLSSFFY
ncbi:maker165 [Drosophila busckii]|uniref:Maker165 n=1 Tax=Drosophila busckii TaxID=30019 RepID=A0A0M4ECX5_DROBS|nr:maker165 [Drosophila busckii]